MESPSSRRSALGDILLRRKAVKADDIERARMEQARTTWPLASTLHRLGAADERTLVSALSEHFGLPGVELGRTIIDLSVLTFIPEAVARSHRILPLGAHEDGIKVAMANPEQPGVIDEIAFATGRQVVPFVALRSEIDRAISESYALRVQGQKIWRGQRAEGATPAIESLKPSLVPPPREVSLETELPEEAPRAPAPIERSSDAVARVLAVDDEEAILELIDRALSKRKIEVLRATRGRQAFDLLQRTTPDVILLDAMLPEIHGFELCSTIKKSERLRDTHVIIISAIYTGWHFAQDVKRLYGADDYLEKPFSVVELVRRVEEVIERRKPPAEASKDLEKIRLAVALECKRAGELLKAGKLEEAQAAAERAVRANPFESRAHFMLGTVLQAQGRIYQAISEYERVVEISPSLFSALKNLAVLYERQGFKAKAVEIWMRALDQSPSDAVRQTIKAHLIGLL